MTVSATWMGTPDAVASIEGNIASTHGGAFLNLSFVTDSTPWYGTGAKA